jgi:tripartite ATP-independent transporter DctP family solute receptor
MKKFVFLALAVFTASAVNAADKKVIEMKLGHFGPDGHPAQIAAQQFADNVQKRTNGAIKVTIYPNNALGNPPEVLEQCILGAIDMSLSGQDQIAKYSQKFLCVGIPFAYKSYSHVDHVLDGPFIKWAAPDLDKQGLVYLSNWEWGFRNLTNSKHPVNKPEDVKGLKIRTPPAIANAETFKALGGIVQTIQFSELVMAMKQGVVDGQENPIAVIHSLKLNESQKYLAMINYNYSSMVHVISKKTWNKMTPEQQKIVKEESQKAGLLMRKLVRDQEKTQIEDLKKGGMQITYPDVSKFRAKMGPAWDAMKKLVGEKNFKEFMDMCDKTK